MQYPTALAALMSTAVLLTACDNPADETFTTTATEAKEVPALPEVQAVEAAQAVEQTEAAPTAAAPQIVALALTGENTTVEWTGSKPTGSTHDGGFKTITGTASLIDGVLASLDATIDIKSMWSDSDRLTRHLLNPDFFESETYPESRFVTTEIRPVESSDVTDPVADATHMVTGNFTLLGETKSITFPAVVAVTDTAVTLDSTFDINRGQFGMDRGIANAAIRDEVIIRLKLDVPLS